MDSPRQVRVVKLVRVANALVRHQFKEFPAERVDMTRGKVGESIL